MSKKLENIDGIEKIKKAAKKQKEVIEKIENRKEVKKVKNVVSDFKKFAIKGNIIDMAVGIIIGTAFTKIVNSLVSEIITPLISTITSKVDLKSLFIPLSEGRFATIADAQAAGVATLNYGVFISNIVDFLIISFTVFIFLRYTFKKREKASSVQETTTPTTKECPYCLSEIPLKATRCAHCTSDVE